MDQVTHSNGSSSYDFLVIGGGPAGATVAAILAETGRSVLVLEVSKFPRFAVGEIIAPTGLWRVWARLGITQEDLDAKFIRKWAGGWAAPDGTVFCFDQDVHPDDSRCRAFVYSLERATYDHMLLELARKRGATALEEASVEDVLKDDAGRVIGVRYRHGGQLHEAFAKLVIDASGRGNVLAQKLGLRVDLEKLRSFSVFAHYEGVVRNEGQQEGDVRITFGKDMWWWFAPLKAPKASIGIVSNRDVFYKEYLEVGPEKFYEKYVQDCPYVWDRIKDARRITGFRPVTQGTGKSTLEDYHYVSREIVGDGFALIGDAGGFVDPIFSAGLYVAQTAAMWLAEEILAAGDDLSKERLDNYRVRYEKDIGAVMKHIARYATDYFDPKFVNFYLGLGARHPKVRKLYIDTFVAYDPVAIKEYTRLIDRYFKDGSGAPANVDWATIGAREGTAVSAETPAEM